MIDSNLPSVAVCFPVYNERTTVGEVLREAHELLSGSGLDYEILVCDDGSTDGSIEIIKGVASQYPNFRVIYHPKNLGIYATFEELYHEAKNEFIFLNSTDQQWETKVILDMVPFTRDWDIIIASRKDKFYGFLRRFISWCFNMLPLILFGVRTFDAGAVKLVKREVVTRFRLISRSPFSEAERLIRAAKAGYHILNYPVNTHPRRVGHRRYVNLCILLEAIRDVFRVWGSIYLEKTIV